MKNLLGCTQCKQRSSLGHFSHSLNRSMGPKRSNHAPLEPQKQHVSMSVGQWGKCENVKKPEMYHHERLTQLISCATVANMLLHNVPTEKRKKRNVLPHSGNSGRLNRGGGGGDITSDHITTHHITSHCITSHCTASHHITAQHSSAHHTTPHDIPISHNTLYNNT